MYKNSGNKKNARPNHEIKFSLNLVNFLNFINSE